LVTPTTVSPDARSFMALEAAQSGTVMAEQLAANAIPIAQLAKQLQRLNPRMLVTIARGSSDNAAAFAKTAFETVLGIPVISQPPSIGSLYKSSSRHLAGQPVLLISQSGSSPDLVASAIDARRAGAYVIALVNVVDSPLAAEADTVIPLHAGPERSVAATKSFVASLAAIAHLVAELRGDLDLKLALHRMPTAVTAAWDNDWSEALPVLERCQSMLVLGRGPTMGIAGEAALKLKETTRLHAEAFSIAEVAHGPMTLVRAGDPILVFVPGDVARIGAAERISAFTARGATVLAVGGAEDVSAAAIRLPGPTGLNPLFEPMAMISSFYRFAEALARLRGDDPDRPPFLNKVTETH
jgi:glucosamine--fructose-6-phosphate aminotransferase (isomerizing)